jgi:hypothetical protein
VVWNGATLIALIAASGVAMVPAAAADRAMLEAANAANVMSASDLDAIEQTSDAIKAAYASGDSKVIMALHHPDVVKAISYDRLLNSFDAVDEDLTRSLAAGRRQFMEQKIENVLLFKGVAIQQALYTIKVSPTDGRAPFLTRGRSMVIYVPYAKSPTGWAILRGFIQPGPK